VGGQRHAPAALLRGRSPDIPFTGGWVGPRAGLDGCGKISPSPGFDPRTVQPVGSCYREYQLPLIKYFGRPCGGSGGYSAA
jgi:hypothetical protein